MDRSEVLTLVSVTYSKDKNGMTRKQEVKRDVFVNVGSVSQTEWFEGKRAGLNSSYKFTMFAYDYNDEDTVEYKGNSYLVYRTYLGKNDNLELYVKKVSGVDG